MDANWKEYLLVPFIINLILIAIILWFKTRALFRKNFIIIGLSGSGKTVLFSQLLYSKYADTFTSVNENVGDYQIGRKSAKVIDIPGHERVREKFLDTYKKNIKGVVFVIDSANIQKNVKDVADFLYTILTDASCTKSSMMILCNKQDDEMAKSGKVVRHILEKELNIIRKTRLSNLKTVDNSESTLKLLGKEDKDFEFSDLNRSIQFGEGSGKNKEISHLKDWIASLM